MSTEVEKKKAIRQQLDDLESAVTQLMGIVGNLQGKLEPILSKEPETGCDAAPADNTCPMSDELSGYVIRVKNITDIIQRLDDHIEI
ncbi:hypothetical protein LCGC14_1858600 [marine sediment metagenome]|uniref:Uncharacterized protein n=1 Tax=marine sediment metagenome TaxID=412755 RepID=A0A0F9J786_9ZZZZ